MVSSWHFPTIVHFVHLRIGKILKSGRVKSSCKYLLFWDAYGNFPSIGTIDVAGLSAISISVFRTYYMTKC